MTTIAITVFNWLFTIASCYIVWNNCIKAYSSGVETYNRTHSVQVLNAIPGTCTAWGIFFTFASIVLCLLILFFIGDSSSFSIFNVAGSIIPAFATSVIGMWFSIKYADSIKITIAEDEYKETQRFGDPAMQLANIAKDTENCKLFFREEFISLLNELVSFHKKSHNELKQVIMGGDNYLINAINDGNTLLSNEIKEQTNAIEKVSGQIAIIIMNLKTQTDSLKNFVNSFTNEFDKFFSTAHSAFEQQMKDFTIAEIRKYTDTLTIIGTQLRNVSESILIAQRETVEKMANGIVDQIKDSNTTISEMLRKHSADTEAHLKSSSTEIASALNSAVTNIQTSAGNSAEAIKEMTRELKVKFSELSSHIVDASLEPLNTLKSEIEFVEKRIGQICENYKQSQQAYSDTLENIHNSNENWEKALNTNKESLANIETTNCRITEMLTVIKERDEGIQQIREEIGRIAQAISQLQELNSNIRKMTAK